MHDFSGYAKYHEKWDWIIPVVKRITEIGSDIQKHTSPLTELEKNRSSSLIYIIMDALTDLSLQGLFDAVYEYVQWYESINKTQEHDRAYKVFEVLKKQYATSEVVSGEFIHSVILTLGFSKEDIRRGVQLFLDWDESEATFDVEQGGLHWIIKEANN
jgi:hypothetical protein